MGERECARVSGVRGWVVCEADAGRTGERDEVQLVCVLTWADEGRDAGGDVVTPNSVQRCHAFVLEEWDGGEDGVGEGRVEEADEHIGLYIAPSLGEWIGHIMGEGEEERPESAHRA